MQPGQATDVDRAAQRQALVENIFPHGDGREAQMPRPEYTQADLSQLGEQEQLRLQE